MPGRDYVIRMRVDGGDVSRREIEEAKKGIIASERSTRAMTQAKRELGVESKRVWGGMTGQVAGALTSLVSVGATIGLVRQAYSGWKQDMQENLRVARQTTVGLTDLLFLGDRVRDPKFRQTVAVAAGKALRGETETGMGLYALESMTSTLTVGQRAKLEAEMFQHARMAKSVPLPDLAKLYGKVASVGGRPGEQFDANVIQNIVAQFMEKAAITNPSEVGSVLTRALAMGPMAGLSRQQMAGLTAEGTAITGSPEMGATGVEALTRVLMGAKGEKLGLRGNLIERIGQLRDKGLSPAKIGELLGESGMRMSELLPTWDQRRGRIGEFVAATGPGRDILGEKLGIAKGMQPEYVYEQQLRRLDIEEEQLKAEEAARDRKAVLAQRALTNFNRRRGAGSLRRSLDTAILQTAIWLGADPERSLESVAGPEGYEEGPLAPFLGQEPRGPSTRELMEGYYKDVAELGVAEAGQREAEIYHDLNEAAKRLDSAAGRSREQHRLETGY